MATSNPNVHSSKYARMYSRFIKDRQEKPEPEGYSETHHIIPRCDGGSNDPSNLIRLTARDHIFAHLILAKWKGGRHWAAIIIMMGRGRYELTPQTIRIAAKVREQSGLAQRGKNNPMFGRKLSEEQKRKALEALRKPRRTKGRSLTPEHRAKMSEARKGNQNNKGKKWSEEQKANHRLRLKGRVHSPETRAKLREALKGRIVPEEEKLKARVARAKKRENSNGR